MPRVGNTKQNRESKRGEASRPGGSGVRLSILAAALAAALPAARGLGPHELAVLVNDASPASLEIANHYIQLRRVPARNVIHLRLPDSIRSPEAQMDPDTFKTQVLEPALAAIRERDLEDHVRAWVFSADFPVRITSTPQLSLNGFTLVRGRVPPEQVVNLGSVAHPFFAGPSREGGPANPSRSLESLFAAAPGSNAPIPSMMLAYTGARGLAVDRAVDFLRQAVAADFTSPTGTVFFQTGGDVRATTRAWQFAEAAAELEKLGLTAVQAAAPAPADAKRPLVGVMAGLADLRPETFGVLQPGAFAEHLTSFGAHFHSPGQTKLTAWLRAGAAGSSGTVCEPYAVWWKFPHARVFAHYASGCTLFEGLWQALASPLQLLLVGEPLCRPWGRHRTFALANLEGSGEAVGKSAHFRLVSTQPEGVQNTSVMLLLDGRLIVLPPFLKQFDFQTGTLPDGYHELRAVLYENSPVRHQSMALADLVFTNRGRSAGIRLPDGKDRVDLRHPFRVEVEAAGDPKDIAVVCQERVLARSGGKARATLTLDPQAIGAGPVTLAAEATYADKEAVRSRPLPLAIERLNRLPEIAPVTREPRKGGGFSATASATDAEGDRVTLDWGLRLPWPDLAARSANIDGRGEVREDTLSFSPIRALGSIVLTHAPDRAATRLEALIQFTSLAHTSNGIPVAGIVWNRRGPDAYAFFGYSADESAWVAGVCSNGALRKLVLRGAPEPPPGRGLRFAVVAGEKGGITGLVDDEPVLMWPQAPPLKAGLGVMGNTPATRYGRLLALPASAVDDRVRISGAKATVEGDIAGLTAIATDGIGLAERAVE